MTRRCLRMGKARQSMRCAGEGRGGTSRIWFADAAVFHGRAARPAVGGRHYLRSHPGWAFCSWRWSWTHSATASWAGPWRSTYAQGISSTVPRSACAPFG
jgi:hypothetical protein